MSEMTLAQLPQEELLALAYLGLRRLQEHMSGLIADTQHVVSQPVPSGLPPEETKRAEAQRNYYISQYNELRAKLERYGAWDEMRWGNYLPEQH